MATRNQILSEIHRRMWEVNGVQAVFRNPRRVPDDLDFPVISFFVGPDTPRSPTTRGGYPAMIREVPVRVELFIEATTEEQAPEEIEALLREVKRELYRGGPNLNGNCFEMTETATSELLVANVDRVIGIALDFTIVYAENIADLF